MAWIYRQFSKAIKIVKNVVLMLWVGVGPFLVVSRIFLGNLSNLFTDLDSLIQPLQTEEGESWQCLVCGKVCKRKYILKDHVQSLHCSSSVGHTCEICFLVNLKRFCDQSLFGEIFTIPLNQAKQAWYIYGVIKIIKRRRKI